jgi:periplasmic protein TonB
MTLRAFIQSLAAHVLLAWMVSQGFEPKNLGALHTPTQLIGVIITGENRKAPPSAKQLGPSRPRGLLPSPGRKAGADGAVSKIAANGEAHPDLNSPGSMANAPSAEPGPLTEYAADVRSRIEARLEYPLSLRRRGIVGRVEILLTIDESGQLEQVRVSQPSSAPELNQLAEEAARKAAPFPPFSGGMGGTKKVTFALPVEFRIS